MKAFHGGQAWKDIGEDFQTLSRFKDVVNADVLDAWFDPAPNVTKMVKKYLSLLIKTAPPTHAHGLIKKISEVRGVPEENIGVSGGSSDIMFVLFQTILKREDTVLILDPMYGEYAHIFENVIKAKLNRYVLSRENNFAISVKQLIDQIESDNPKLVALVNPNSPTGKILPAEQLLTIVRSFPDTIFVIDETYIEYVGRKASLEKEAVYVDNLVIITSMSKAYALSGVRVGYFVTNKSLADRVSTYIPPWSVGSIGQFAAIEALHNPDYYKRKYKETHVLRKQMVDRLTIFSEKIKVYDSCANFLLIELLSVDLHAEMFVSALREKGVFIRNCDSMSNQFEGRFIRVAVKSKSQNIRVINEMGKLLK